MSPGPVAALRWYCSGTATVIAAGRFHTLAIRTPECNDGLDNDGDAFIDAADPGCQDAASVREDPQCQDGINNDPGQDDLIDFDGGLSALGYVATDPDPQCVGSPWKNKERSGVCGLGAELALLLPLLWLWRRRATRKR